MNTCGDLEVSRAILVVKKAPSCSLEEWLKTGPLQYFKGNKLHIASDHSNTLYTVGSKSSQPALVMELDTRAIFSLILDYTHKTDFDRHQCPLEIECPCRIRRLSHIQRFDCQHISCTKEEWNILHNRGTID